MVKKYGLVEKSTEIVSKDPDSYQKIQDCFICSEPIASVSSLSFILYLYTVSF